MKNENVILGLLDYKRDHDLDISDDYIDASIRAIQKVEAIEDILRSWSMNDEDFTYTYLCEIRDIVSNEISVGDSE